MDNWICFMISCCEIWISLSKRRKEEISCLNWKNKDSDWNCYLCSPAWFVLCIWGWFGWDAALFVWGFRFRIATSLFAVLGLTNTSNAPFWFCQYLNLRSFACIEFVCSVPRFPKAALLFKASFIWSKYCFYRQFEFGIMNQINGNPGLQVPYLCFFRFLFGESFQWFWSAVR